MRFRGLSNAVRQHFRRDGKAKVPYESRVAAEINVVKGQHAYRCDFCGHWHVGSSG